MRIARNLLSSPQSAINRICANPIKKALAGEQQRFMQNIQSGILTGLKKSIMPCLIGAAVIGGGIALYRNCDKWLPQVQKTVSNIKDYFGIPQPEKYHNRDFFAIRNLMPIRNNSESNNLGLKDLLLPQDFNAIKSQLERRLEASRAIAPDSSSSQIPQPYSNFYCVPLKETVDNCFYIAVKKTLDQTLTSSDVEQAQIFVKDKDAHFLKLVTDRKESGVPELLCQESAFSPWNLHLKQHYKFKAQPTQCSLEELDSNYIQRAMEREKVFKSKLRDKIIADINEKGIDVTKVKYNEDYLKKIAQDNPYLTCEEVKSVYDKVINKD